MIYQDMEDHAVEKGKEDGAAAAPWSPPLRSAHAFGSIIEAYNSAYWHAISQQPPRAPLKVRR